MQANGNDAGVLVQVGMRIPKRLHRAVKLRCVEREERVADFVAEALRDKLRRVGIRRV